MWRSTIEFDAAKSSINRLEIKYDVFARLNSIKFESAKNAAYEPGLNLRNLRNLT